MYCPECGKECRKLDVRPELGSGDADYACGECQVVWRYSGHDTYPGYHVAVSRSENPEAYDAMVAEESVGSQFDPYLPPECQPII